MTIEQSVETVQAVGSNGLPQIVNYDSTADLPAAYNALSVATDVALDRRLAIAGPSPAVNTPGFRRVHIGETAPSGAQAGDVWLQT